MQSTGCIWPGGPTPTSAVRLTEACVLKTASQGIVKSVPSAVVTRCDFRPQNQIRPCASR